jgi:hypothetical protein
MPKDPVALVESSTSVQRAAMHWVVGDLVLMQLAGKLAAFVTVVTRTVLGPRDCHSR